MTKTNKINFTRLTFKNFMSYGPDETSIDFDNTMTLITGKNGEGKTTQFIALYYALFGKPYKKVKLGSLINSITSKDLLVVLEFNIGNDFFRIVRGQKPNLFEIHKNEELINQSSSISDYQTMLETDILKFNENIFKQLIFLGANVNTTKSFVDLSKAEKEDMFQTITDTSIFSELKEAIKIKVKDLNLTKTELDYKIKVLDELIFAETVNIKKLEIQNASILEQNDDYITELKASINDIDNVLSKYNDGLERIKLKKPEYDENKAKYITLKQELEETNSLLTEDLATLNKIEAVENTFSNCIGCDKLKLISPVDINSKQDVLDSITKTKSLLHIRNISLKTLDEEIEKLNEIFNKGKQLKLSRDSKLEEKIRVEKELANLESRKQNIVSIDSSVLDSKILEKEQNSITLDEVNDYLVKYTALTKLFDNANIKGLIIKQSLPVLNKFINEYLDSFSDFPFKFSVDANFVSSIKFNNEDYEFLSLSNGQAMRITFSIVLAFLRLVEHKNGITTNLLILDEILDSSLDSTGREELLNLIKYSFKNKSIFVISHNDDIIGTEVFDKSYTIKREDSFSRMLSEV